MTLTGHTKTQNMFYCLISAKKPTSVDMKTEMFSKNDYLCIGTAVNQYYTDLSYAATHTYIYETI